MNFNNLKKFLPYNDNIYYQWFIVQYDESPQKCTRKVVRTDELIWNEELQQIECDDGERREHVLVRDQGRLHLGYILYKSKTQDDCMEHYRFLQIFLIQTLSDIRDRNWNQMCNNHNFWVMVMYNRSPDTYDQATIAIFHKRDVIFKVDNQTHALMAFIQEDNATYKGLVIKLNSDLEDMMFLLRFIKKEMLMFFLRSLIIHESTRDEEANEDIDRLLKSMVVEAKQLYIAQRKLAKKKAEVKTRLAYVMKLLHTNRAANAWWWNHHKM